MLYFDLIYTFAFSIGASLSSAFGAEAEGLSADLEAAGAFLAPSVLLADFLAGASVSALAAGASALALAAGASASDFGAEASSDFESSFAGTSVSTFCFFSDFSIFFSSEDLDFSSLSFFSSSFSFYSTLEILELSFSGFKNSNLSSFESDFSSFSVFLTSTTFLSSFFSFLEDVFSDSSFFGVSDFSAPAFSSQHSGSGKQFLCFGPGWSLSDLIFLSSNLAGLKYYPTSD